MPTIDIVESCITLDDLSFVTYRSPFPDKGIDCFDKISQTLVWHQPTLTAGHYCRIRVSSSAILEYGGLKESINCVVRDVKTGKPFSKKWTLNSPKGNQINDVQFIGENIYVLRESKKIEVHDARGKLQKHARIKEHMTRLHLIGDDFLFGSTAR